MSSNLKEKFNDLTSGLCISDIVTSYFAKQVEQESEGQISLVESCSTESSDEEDKSKHNKSKHKKRKKKHKKHKKHKKKKNKFKDEELVTCIEENREKKYTVPSEAILFKRDLSKNNAKPVDQIANSFLRTCSFTSDNPKSLGLFSCEVTAKTLDSPHSNVECKIKVLEEKSDFNPEFSKNESIKAKQTNLEEHSLKTNVIVNFEDKSGDLSCTSIPFRNSNENLIKTVNFDNKEAISQKIDSYSCSSKVSHKLKDHIISQCIESDQLYAQVSDSNIVSTLKNSTKLFNLENDLNVKQDYQKYKLSIYANESSSHLSFSEKNLNKEFKTNFEVICHSGDSSSHEISSKKKKKDKTKHKKKSKKYKRKDHHSQNRSSSSDDSQSRYKSRSREKNRCSSRTRSKGRSLSRERSREKTQSRARYQNEGRSQDRSWSRGRSLSRERSSGRRSWSRGRSHSRSCSRVRNHSKDRSWNIEKTQRRDRSRDNYRSNKFKRRNRSSSSSRRNRHPTSHDSRYRNVQSSKHSSLSTDKKSTKSNIEEETNDDEKIDKTHLLNIARKNVLTMIEKGTLPKGLNQEVKQEEVLSIKSGGKSVQELTEFCRTLTELEKDGSDKEISPEKEIIKEQPFIHHPFKLKEPQPVIKLNIKNAIQIPVKTHAEKATESARLRLQFPVSSGSQHRQKELEWIPVEKDSPNSVMDMSQKDESAVSLVSTEVLEEDSSSFITELKKNINSTTVETVVLTEPDEPVSINIPLPPPPPPLAPLEIVTSTTTIQPMTFVQAEQVFPMQPIQAVDVSVYLAQRLNAIQKLQSNPNDIAAMNQLYIAEQQIQTWVASKQLPGQYTGSTDVRVLTASELSGPTPVWAKKDQFIKAAPLTGGIGMSLLKKMGWNPGEGLGKNKEGALEPLVLDIKTDKRGLVSEGELATKFGTSSAVLKDLSGKHPVSFLMELCTKRKWLSPEYILVSENGPSHKKNFLFKVRVNNLEYQSATSSLGKKAAKAQAAIACLQSLGILSKNFENPVK